MKNKNIEELAVGCTAFGIFGFVGAIEADQFPTGAILLIIVGLAFAAYGFAKGVFYEEDIEPCDYHDASYPSYLRRS